MSSRVAELWAVVNNAGVACSSEIEWCPMSTFEKMMQVNTFGPVRVTKAFLPLLRQSAGRVVNVASVAGRSGSRSQSADRNRNGLSSQDY